MAPTVWTNRRKWMGNLIPMIFWIPPAGVGLIIMVRTQEIIGPGLWLLIVATVAGWLAVNQFGFFENARMKRQLELILESREEPKEDGPFVGVATPRFSSLIDPHEEVGYLRMYADRLSFVSETRSIEMMRDQITKIRFRANVHTILGLGRWVSVEGMADEQAFRLLIEPRERRTLLGNLRYSTLLSERLRRWRKGGNPTR